jgi:hypothetical protein
MDMNMWNLMYIAWAGGRETSGGESYNIVNTFLSCIIS